MQRHEDNGYDSAVIDGTRYSTERGATDIRQVYSEFRETPTLQRDIQNYHSERGWSIENVRKTVMIDGRNT